MVRLDSEDGQYSLQLVPLTSMVDDFQSTVWNLLLIGASLAAIGALWVFDRSKNLKLQLYYIYENLTVDW